MFSIKSYLKMLVSLCNSFLFITFTFQWLSAVPLVPGPHLSFHTAFLLSPKAVSLTPCSAVLCSGTKHNDSSRNTHFYQNAMPPDSWVVWKEKNTRDKEREKNRENSGRNNRGEKWEEGGGRRGAAMKRASVLKRGAKPQQSMGPFLL